VSFKKTYLKGVDGKWNVSVQRLWSSGFLVISI